ncbi:uncharacterized protein SCDLUD_000173 [Saccharomycodes ludwigii]|uniref:uncharacterized protein n=1 Tax=Saccharomycodes ludwigii TaxID=36035 RepID=UPI001E84CA9F|nr:hypothetical protein SCDLUD_000173 [Saccharomycodes ludwigii]KAH3902593.1 hypothetical protein SCDLUD_000173 [Saccharomycodes ludwigii]
MTEENNVTNLIIELTYLLNHSIHFEPHLLYKNTKNDYKDYDSNSGYILPVMVSDKIKIYSGCLPLEVYNTYEKIIHNVDDSTVDKRNIYMNRELSNYEYKKLVRVLSFCYQILYECILSFNNNNNNKKRIFEKNFFHNHMLLSENRFSLVFKTFVGITFREYDFYCLEFIKKNYGFLKVAISFIQRDSLTGYIKDYTVWNEIATNLLRNWSKVKLDTYAAKNASTFFTYTLANSTNLYHNNCKQNTTMRRKILIDRIPNLARGDDRNNNSSYFKILEMSDGFSDNKSFPTSNPSEICGYISSRDSFQTVTNINNQSSKNFNIPDFNENTEANTISNSNNIFKQRANDKRGFLNNFQLAYRDFCNFNDREDDVDYDYSPIFFST